MVKNTHIDQALNYTTEDSKKHAQGANIFFFTQLFKMLKMLYSDPWLELYLNLGLYFCI